MQKLSSGDLFHERYRIVNEIGSGGMGVVYHAIQIDVNRDVALKLLKIDVITNEKDRQRFIREFKILSKLNCDNIMAFYALSLTPEGAPYAVCEYLEGLNLSSILETEGRLPWRRALAIAMQIARGLQFAHNMGVIHRDLKPSNIMILDKPEPDTVKLIDFGLARINEFANEQKLTRTGQLLGTPHYMSPELVMNKTVDGRSDIYALACVLYELISGEKLFDAQSTLGIVQQHALEDPAERLAKIKPLAPAALIDLLEKMLSKSPDDRPASMADLLPVFDSLLSSSDLLSGTEWSSSSKKIVKPFKGVIVLSAVIVLIVSLVVWKKFDAHSNPPKFSNSKAKSSDLLPRRGQAVVELADRTILANPAASARVLKSWLSRYGKHDATTVEKIQVLRVLAGAESRMFNFEEAAKYSEQAVALCDSVDLDNMESRQAVIAALESRAEILLGRGKRAESLAILKKELHLILNCQLGTADGIVVENCLHTLIKHGEYDLVVKSAMNLVPKWESSRVHSDVAGLFLLAGDASVCDNKVEKAWGFYRDSLAELVRTEPVDPFITRRFTNNLIAKPLAPQKDDASQLAPYNGQLLSSIAERIYYFDPKQAPPLLKTAIELTEQDLPHQTELDSRDWKTMGTYALKMNLADETLLCLKSEIAAFDKGAAGDRDFFPNQFQKRCKLADALLYFDKVQDADQFFDKSCESFSQQKSFNPNILMREKFKFACLHLGKKLPSGKKYYDDALAMLTAKPEFKSLAVLAWCSYAQQLQGMNAENMWSFADKMTQIPASQVEVVDYCDAMIGAGRLKAVRQLLQSGWGYLEGRISAYLALADEFRRRGKMTDARQCCQSAFELSRQGFPLLSAKIDDELVSKLMLAQCK